MTNSIFSQDSLSHLRACGWERCPYFLRFSKLSDQNINLFPINRSGILTNLWNFPLIQVFLIVYHWSALILFDRVFCPVIAFQTCSLAVCEGFRKAIVAAAKRELRFPYKLLTFIPCDEVQTRWWKKRVPVWYRSPCPIFLWWQSEQLPRGDEIMRSEGVFWRRSPFVRDRATVYIPIRWGTWGKETIGETKT